MLNWLFGKKKNASKPDGPSPEDTAADEAFGKAKEQALVRVLGPMDEMVYHSLIPFFIGGGLDLYTFSKCTPGVVFATQELIGRAKGDRSKPGRAGFFELVACLPPSKPRDDKEGIRLINSVLNPVARYASMASLNPNETAEIPGQKGEQTLPVLFDTFNPKGVNFEFSGEKFHLLLCMALHHSELAHARAKGTAGLIKRLRDAGVYPYSYLDRPPVA